MLLGAPREEAASQVISKNAALPSIIGRVTGLTESQQITSVGAENTRKKRLPHREDAEAVYRVRKGQKVGVRLEASGHARWFERLVGELQFERCSSSVVRLC